MPSIFHKKEAAFSLGIWRMDEEPEEMLKAGVLSAKDAAHANSFQSIARKKEWICTRLLLAEMLPAMNLSIEYDEHGKPHLQNTISEKEVERFHISVSHTRDYVSVIVSEKYPVAVDIELIHPRIEKIENRFLSAEEMRKVPAEKKLEHLYMSWSAKECLYKLYGKKELIFKENLLVKSFRISSKGIIPAGIVTKTMTKDYILNYEFLNHLLIVYIADVRL